MVARECNESLTQSLDELISLETSDATQAERKPGVCSIMVMAHATALARILREKMVPKNTLVIVDEYHMGQAETVALVKWLVSLCEKDGIDLYLFSATGTKSVAPKTNFSVRNDVIPSKDVR